MKPTVARNAVRQRNAADETYLLVCEYGCNGENTEIVNFEFLRVKDGELSQCKLDMQDAFQRGYEAEFGKTDTLYASYYGMAFM